MRKIQRIICLNNPNCREDPDSEDNNDERGPVKSAKTFRPKDIAREMTNLLEMFKELKELVEIIRDSVVRADIEDQIDALEILRRDVRNNNQDKINAKEPKAENSPEVKTFLVFNGGDNDARQDWS